MAGFTGQTALRASTQGRIYVNDDPSHRAPCDGTVYAWHYCYYDERRRDNLQVGFGAYDYDRDDERYRLRSGSHYLLQLDRREESFTCGTVALEESEYFRIREGDRVGACLRDGGRGEPHFLDILAEDDNNRVARWGRDSGQCRESDMRQSPEEQGTTSGYVLHLYVDISN